MLDSSIIGKVVYYGDYLCVIDNILDYKEGIIQLRINSGKYDSFKFSVDSCRINETYDGLILYVDIKRVPTLGDEWLIDLHTVEGGHLLNCDWYRSIDMCIYDYANKETAALDYNNQVSNMIKAREKYITDMLQKELSQFDKYFVKHVSYKKEYK